MNGIMLFVYFIIVALAVVYSALKVTKCVSAFNEKSDISSGFIGIVLFSAITSLPELLTSVYSIKLGLPTMAFGNVLGSNAFNLFILAIINLIFFKKFIFNNVDKANLKVTILVVVLNIIVLLGFKYPVSIDVGFTKVSYASLAIFLIYVVVLYRLYKSGDLQEEEEPEPSGLGHLSKKSIITRGIIYIALMVVSSLILTKICDAIALTYPEFGATLVGTLLLAIATSLPEVVSTYSLCKMNHGNMAISGIVGSNLFNFNNMFLGDLFSNNQAVFQAAHDSKDLGLLTNLTYIGTFMAVLVIVKTMMPHTKNKFVYALIPVLMILSYIWFVNNAV